MAQYLDRIIIPSNPTPSSSPKTFTHHRPFPPPRAPTTCAIRQRMIYASSKLALRQRLDGIHTEVQATDSSELAFESVFEQIAPKLATAVIKPPKVAGAGQVFLDKDESLRDEAPKAALVEEVRKEEEKLDEKLVEEVAGLKVQGGEVVREE
ncbi:hypothetical protein HK097_010499 [Rhizophlyctis rosea]|uniref:ADF-H domain-containing protein n=1 Tax=Rhizophlyctis rosea TaxID=64517 RepID=A0AAD5SAR9_9FUNG|nr:hypothetical protein HK097_010499 [Rhizophlyctis rosea]